MPSQGSQSKDAKWYAGKISLSLPCSHPFPSQALWLAAVSPARARPSTSRSTVLPSKPVGTDRFQNPELFRFQTDRKARVHVLSNPSPTSIGSVWDDSPAPLQEPCHSRGNSTVIGISNNCKCLHILLALVLLPHKFATNQGKDLVFRDFFFGLGDCGRGTVDL